jgi:succinyl-CoA synthetase beta subunit
MNLHEYQGKSILKSYGVAIQEGIVVDRVEDAVEAAKKLTEQTGTSWYVVKAQIHAGGRGKGTVEETGSHGVVLAKGIDQVEEKVKGILGGHLTTLQTNGKGKLVSKVLIAQDVYYPGPTEVKEFYMSVLLDREKGRNVIVYSTEGGMDIEHVAEHTPERIHREFVDPRVGLQGFQARKIAFNLGLSGEAFKGMTKFVANLYKAYEGIDASMFEINPLFKTSDDKIIAVLKGDQAYGDINDISEMPKMVVDRVRHFFLTYKDLDGAAKNVEITHVYGKEEAYEVIKLASEDYTNKFFDHFIVYDFETIYLKPKLKKLNI